MENSILKHLQFGNITYDFDATYLGGKNLDWIIADVKRSINTAEFVVSTNAGNTPNITELYDPIGVTGIQGELIPEYADKNNIYLVLTSGSYYEEYVVTQINETYKWIHLGNTDVELSEYIKRGEKRTTTENGGFTVTPTVSVTYDKANDYTGKGFGDTTKSTTAVASTGTATFSGSIATFSPTATLENYNPTLTVTKATEPIVFVTGMKTEAGGYHNHKVSTHTHETQTVVNGITFTPSSLSTGTVQMLRSITPKTGSFLQGDVTGDTLILTGSSAVTSIVEGYSTVISSINFTSSSLSSTTVNVAGVSSAATITTSSVDAHTHTLYNTVLEPVMDVSINPGKPSISISSITYTPEGSISITMNTHSHEYIAPAAHQHSISYTATTATGSATITISPHTHKVNL